jgi:hypothetical protein
MAADSTRRSTSTHCNRSVPANFTGTCCVHQPDFPAGRRGPAEECWRPQCPMTYSASMSLAIYIPNRPHNDADRHAAITPTPVAAQRDFIRNCRGCGSVRGDRMHLEGSSHVEASQLTSLTLSPMGTSGGSAPYSTKDRHRENQRRYFRAVLIRFNCGRPSAARPSQVGCRHGRQSDCGDNRRGQGRDHERSSFGLHIVRPPVRVFGCSVLLLSRGVGGHD